MELSEDSKLLRIFIGDIDKIGHQPLYEAIVFAALKNKLAGCTVLKGVMSYGASTRVHTIKLIEICDDLPVVVEIVDHDDKIKAFVEVVNELMEKANCGGLITIEKATVLYYKSAPKK